MNDDDQKEEPLRGGRRTLGVVKTRDTQAFIDFDDAHPGSRRDDLGYASWLWLDIGSDEIAAAVQYDRLQRFVSDYGLRGDWQAGSIVRAAQERHVENANLADHVRQWSAQCLEWTTRQEWD